MQDFTAIRWANNIYAWDFVLNGRRDVVFYVRFLWLPIYILMVTSSPFIESVIGVMQLIISEKKHFLKGFVFTVINSVFGSIDVCLQQSSHRTNVPSFDHIGKFFTVNFQFAQTPDCFISAYKQSVYICLYHHRGIIAF